MKVALSKFVGLASRKFAFMGATFSGVFQRIECHFSQQISSSSVKDTTNSDENRYVKQVGGEQITVHRNSCSVDFFSDFITFCRQILANNLSLTLKGVQQMQVSRQRTGMLWHWTIFDVYHCEIPACVFSDIESEVQGE